MNNELQIKETFLYESPKNKNADYNVWMCFPGIYSFSMSSLGFLWVFKLIDMIEDINIERICTDTQKTKIMLKDVNLVGFSFSFDLDFMNIFKILDKHKIPIKSCDRGEEYPLVFGGGPVLTTNPAPFKDFFDFFIIGDGEKSNKDAINVCKLMKDKSKDETLKALSDIEGVYVPKYPKSIKKSVCDLSECVFTPILSEKSFFKNTLIMEIARGCANRCGFCIASYINLPARFADYDTIINIIDNGLKYTHRIALLGALISAHPDFAKICTYIRKKREEIPDLELSVSSLRADSIEPDVVKTLVECGQKHTTIAIEAASERLRKVINKNLSNEQIFKTAEIAEQNGLKGLKIYAMIGIPTETDDDIKAMVTLAKELKNCHKGFDLTFSFSTFVPKPHTPFQWCGRENTKSLEKKQNYLKKEFAKLGIKARFSSAKWDYWQGVLSRGDERLGAFIYRVYELGGNVGAFKTAYREFTKTRKLPSADYFSLRDIPLNEELPWDFIEIKPAKEFLQKEHDRLISQI